jgi:hypothetical protein
MAARGSDRVSTVENLYRLSVNRTRQFRARTYGALGRSRLRRSMEVFTVDTDQGVTGLVLTGRGEMRFEPAPETEKGQVRIFAGDTKIESRFDAAFVRVGDLGLHANPNELVAAAVDPRELRRADEIFRVESGKSYALELGDNRELVAEPAAGDFVAEMWTNRFETLTHAAAARPRTSASSTAAAAATSEYSSAERLTTRGPFYNEDDLAAYDPRQTSI